MADKPTVTTIKIRLTPEQQEEIKQRTGKKVSWLNLVPEPLEGRAVPRLSANTIYLYDEDDSETGAM